MAEKPKGDWLQRLLKLQEMEEGMYLQLCLSEARRGQERPPESQSKCCKYSYGYSYTSEP